MCDFSDGQQTGCGKLYAGWRNHRVSKY